MRSIEEQQAEQLFDSYNQAVKSLIDQGFKYKEQHSVKEDKMFIYRKGKSYKVLTSRYDRYIGVEWIIRKWYSIRGWHGKNAVVNYLGFRGKTV